MKKVLLLGANGQLGNDVGNIIRDQEDISLIPLTRSEFDLENLTNIEDILDKYYPFDWVINTAAYHKTDECENNVEETFKINTYATHSIAKYCQNKGVGLIFISTDYVFDGKTDSPYKETENPNPVNVYGVSKLAAEKLVAAYCEKYFIFRVASLFGVAGARGKGGNFVTTMLKLHEDKKTINVIDDIVSSPTHTLDIARAITFFISKNISDYGIYHCVNTGKCSWYDFTKKIFEIAGKPDAKIEAISHTQFKSIAKRPLFSALDNTKLSKVFSMPTWQEALAEYFSLKNESEETISK